VANCWTRLPIRSFSSATMYVIRGSATNAIMSLKHWFGSTYLQARKLV